MKSALTVVNAVGVSVLAIVSVFQWREASSLRHRRDELVVRTEALSKRLAETETSLAAVSSTAEEFRRRIEALDADNARLTKALRECESRATRLAAEVARLEKAVGAWKAAVAERDKSIGELNAQAERLIGDRNEAVQRHNDLVKRHNELAARVVAAEKAESDARARLAESEAALRAALAVTGAD